MFLLLLHLSQHGLLLHLDQRPPIVFPERQPKVLDPFPFLVRVGVPNLCRRVCFRALQSGSGRFEGGWGFEGGRGGRVGGRRRGGGGGG